MSIKSATPFSLAPLCALALFAASYAQESKPAAKKPPAKKPSATAAKSAAAKKSAAAAPKPAAAAPKSATEPTAKTTPTATAAKKSAARPKTAAGGTPKSQPAKAGAAAADGGKLDTATEAGLKARLEEILKLPAWERIAELDDYLDQDLPDSLSARAHEHFVIAEAAYGDERLAAGDAARGVKLLRDAAADAPPNMPDRLYFEVVSQLPANLYLRGQADAAFEVARAVEKKAGGDARRLLALAPFYLSVERADEAARLAEAAAKAAPDLSAAHQALGAARRQMLRLDDAAAAYARALELDPKSGPARHSLADLRRAAGKSEEAIALYRELLASDGKNAAARSGLALALLDAGRTEESERLLEAALKDDPRDVSLLAGAAYGYAARGDHQRALDLAGRAVQVEPRHPWAQVALARALAATNRPADAERSLRFARLHSRFPTLDYELAAALAAAGLYEEAAEELARSFSLKGARVETRLAGRVAASAPGFVELLAPERRASLFAPKAADTDEQARSLRSLLALHVALRSTDPGAPDAAAEAAAVAAALEFAKSDDAMSVFRRLYAASRLLRRGIAPRAALELVEAAKPAVDAGLDTPQATVAVGADELQPLRAGAVAQGSTPDIPPVPREVLSKLVRGRIEELTGWALLRQGRAGEAVAALKRAVGVLPADSLYWRSAQWRLGTALAASGERAEALSAYVKAYDPGTPDPARRATIESLYRSLNGSLTGLDIMIGAANAPARPVSPAASRGAGAAPAAAPAAEATAAQSESHAAAPTVESARPAETTAEAPKVEAAADAKPADVKGGEAEPSESEAKPAAAKAGGAKEKEAKSEAKAPEPKEGEPKAGETKESEAKPAEAKPAEARPDELKPAESKPAETAASGEKPPETKAAEPTPTPAPAATEPAAEGAKPAAADAAPAGAGRVRARHTATRGAANCTVALSADALDLKAGSGSAAVVVTLEGQEDLSKVTATTPNWSDIIVLREPASASEPGTAKFTITSISKTAGSYAVQIKSPCGAKELTVRVQ